MKFIRYRKINKHHSSIPADLVFGDGYGFEIPVPELVAHHKDDIRTEDDDEDGWERLYVSDSTLKIAANRIKSELAKYLPQFRK